MFGSSIAYGFTGIINFEELAKVFSGASDDKNLFVLVSLLFLIVGFLFKLSAAPFHMWSPDVYEGSPIFVTAFFSTVPKIAVLGLFTRILLFCFYDFISYWQNITLVCAVISMGFACLAALSQKKVKRLLAFSSITHIGYILAALSCGTLEGLQSLLVYLVLYILMTLNFFASLLSLRNSFSFNEEFKYINDFRMLSKTNGLLAFNLTVVLFSMVGIPPLAGFWSKFYLFFATISSSLYTVALVGVLASVVSCFFYIRMIKTMYFESLSTSPIVKPVMKKWVSYEPLDREKSIIIAISFFTILLIIGHLNILFLLTHKASLTFFG